MAAHKSYTAQEGDTFKKIAQAIFGDEIVAKVLAQFNKMNEVDAITGGTALKIPNRVHIIKKATNQNGVPTSHVDVLMPKDRLVTFDQLKNISGASDALVNKYLDHINEAMKKFEITTPLRKAHFLAQICHESACLRLTSESDSGSRYEGRQDLGNTQDGDGPRFKGRGLIQITGRINYYEFGEYMGDNFTENDAWLNLADDPATATMSAGWFWQVHSKKVWGACNPFADEDSVLKITLAVNGGFTNLADRIKILDRAYTAFGLTDSKDRIKSEIKIVDENVDKINSLLPGQAAITFGDLTKLQKEKKITGFERFLYNSFKTKDSVDTVRKQVNP